MITLTLYLDPQWELAVHALAPQIETALEEGLITESDIDDVLWKAAVRPYLHCAP